MADNLKDGVSSTDPFIQEGMQPRAPPVAPPAYYDMPVGGPYSDIPYSKSDEFAGAAAVHQSPPEPWSPAASPPARDPAQFQSSNLSPALVVNGPRGQQQVLLLQPDGTYNLPAQQGASRVQTFAWHIALSCCIVWCCFWPLGIVAFILAIIANRQSKRREATKARRLGIASLSVSLAGLVVGIIIIVILVVARTKEEEVEEETP